MLINTYSNDIHERYRFIRMMNEDITNYANCLSISLVQHLLYTYTVLSSILATEHMKFKQRAPNFH
jgi:hypothetical protein